MDPFHVTQWATQALDEVRRQVWNGVRGGKGRSTPASRSLKNARFALWKNPEDLTEHQRAQLQFIARAHPALHRAYLLKEGLRLALKSGPDTAQALEGWIRLITRLAFGFKDPESLIALAMLKLGGHHPHLPHRQPA